MVARTLKDSEKEKLGDYKEYEIAKDALTVSVNAENPIVGTVDDMSTDTIRKIFAGEITTWDQVDASLPAERIQVYIRDLSGGAYEVFQKSVMGDSKVTDAATQSASMTELATNIANNKWAIGYAGFGAYNKANANGTKLVAMKVDGVEATEANIVSGDYKDPASRHVRGRWRAHRLRAGLHRLHLLRCRHQGHRVERLHPVVHREIGFGAHSHASDENGRGAQELRGHSVQNSLVATLALAGVAALAAVLVTVAVQGWPIVSEVGLSAFLLSNSWMPVDFGTGASFGIANFIAGSVAVSVLALALALLVAIGCALFLSCAAGPAALRAALCSAIDLLAGIPSVVYGFVGLEVVSKAFIEAGHPSGNCVLTAGIVLAVMVLPFMVSSMTESMLAVRQRYFAASLNLGVGSGTACMPWCCPCRCGCCGRRS